MVLVEVGCQPLKLPSAKSVDQGRGSELSLCSSHLFHVPGNALAQGLRAENSHHTLKMQQGNSLEERGMRHRLQKQTESESKAKNKCLLMHWVWPVTPITWFFWVFSIFKRGCFPRRQTSCWLGCRPPCEASRAGAHAPSSTYKLPWLLGLNLLSLSWGWTQKSLMPPTLGFPL